jgi:lipid-A-disaccharide synthase-like uncharacterized protein
LAGVLTRFSKSRAWPSPPGVRACRRAQAPSRHQRRHRGDPVFETLGVAGIVISMLAYVPQVVHLGRQHCSAGISRRAWAMWLVSSLLVGTLAVHRRDLVFILLQLSTLTSAAVIRLWRRDTAEWCAKFTRSALSRRISMTGRERPEAQGGAPRLPPVPPDPDAECRGRSPSPRPRPSTTGSTSSRVCRWGAPQASRPQAAWQSAHSSSREQPLHLAERPIVEPQNMQRPAIRASSGQASGRSRRSSCMRLQTLPSTRT